MHSAKEMGHDSLTKFIDRQAALSGSVGAMIDFGPNFHGQLSSPIEGSWAESLLVEKVFKANKRLLAFLQRHIRSWNVWQQVRDSRPYAIAGIVLYVYINLNGCCQTAHVAQWSWMHVGSERSLDRFLSPSGGFCAPSWIDKAGHAACQQAILKN